MITTVEADLLNYKSVTHVVHQANLYHTFGAGLAKQIRMQWPVAYNADMTTVYGDRSRLGTWTSAQVWHQTASCLTIINLYSQDGISSKERTTDYISMERGLENIRSWLSNIDGARLGIPYKMGCGLAGGDWERVSHIIDSVFKSATFDVVICRRSGD